MKELICRTHERTPDPSINLRSFIESGLEEKRKFPKEKTYKWTPALFYSSDAITLDFQEKLSSEEPNGYLIGVGMGGIFSLIESFSHPPLGIIAIDIDPHVVIAGRLFVESLRDSGSFEELVENFFTISEEDYQDRVDELLKQEKFLSKGVRRWKKHSWQRDLHTPMKTWVDNLNSVGGARNRIKVPNVIEKNFDILRNLARNNKIAVGLADISDNHILDIFRTLPSYNQSTNVVYLSNAVGLSDKMRRYNHLRRLEDSGDCIYVFSKRGNTELEFANSIEYVISQAKGKDIY